ncbi:MAG: hypothetical protein C0599_17665 [Salinivirgaceae bacterium]|nr:MAG: hypothetical protein C0599_17665 [Salinivirgaceae bacterium]
MIVQPIKMKDYTKSELSDNFRFSSAVAGFGMYLSKSEFLKDIGLDGLIQIASGSKGIDAEGYRSEFLQLMKLTKDL